VPARRRDGYIAWTLIAVLALCIAFIGGEKIGEYFEHQKFELAKEFSVIRADQYLEAGNFEKAISTLHFTKAYERLRGESDAMLARAYLGNSEPCLAQAFADSHLRYMERNKLTPLSSYASSGELYARASQACANVLRPATPPPNTAK